MTELKTFGADIDPRDFPDIASAASIVAITEHEEVPELEPAPSTYTEPRRVRVNAAKARLDAHKLGLGGCVDCGYNSHACALDFDHRPGEVKLFNVSSSPTRSWESTLAEMAKCDLVCANCHRVRTKGRSMFAGERERAIAIMRAAGIPEDTIAEAFPLPLPGSFPPKIAPPSPAASPTAAEVAPAPGSPVPPPGEPGPKQFPRPGPCAARNGHPHLPARYKFVSFDNVLGVCQCGHEFPVPCPHRKTQGPGLGERGDITCQWCPKVIISGGGFIDNRNPAWSGRSRAGAADPKAGVRVLSPGDQPAPTAYRGTAVNA